MPVAHLIELPNDVLLVLADILPDAAINVLTQTSRRFSATFNHVLYSRNARQQNSLALQWAAYYGVVGTVRKALAAGADLDSRRLPPRHPRHNIHRAFYEASDARKKIPYHTALTIAALEGRLEIASILIEAGAIVDVDPKKNYDSTPFTAAIQGDHLDMVKLLIATGNIHFDSFAKYGINILTQAVITSSIDLIRYILPSVRGADLHAPMMPTPLILAVKSQRLDVVKLLLSSENITPDTADDHGRTALAWAAAATDDTTGAVLELLLNSGLFNLNSTDRRGRTPISLAASSGNGKAVSLLLARPDVDPNIADNGGLTPIFHALPHSHIMGMFLQSSQVTIQLDALFRAACRKASTNVLKQLLKFNLGHHNTADETSSTWLHVAATHGQIDTVKLLLKQNDIDINQQRADGFTPLLCAVEGKHRAATNALLQANADVNITTQKGWSALCYASQGNNIALVEELLRRRSDISKTIDTGETALHIACRHGGPKVVQVLLAHGADPMLHANTNQTPLHIACVSRREPIVELLLAKIPYAHALLRTGRTPLHDACESGHVSIVKLLLEHGADPNATLEDGTTPLEMASRGNSLIAKLLLERGANPQQLTSVGATLLHAACEHNSLDAASLLIEYCANTNAIDNTGSTPLHNACIGGSSALVGMLVKHGAAVTAVKHDGSTPLHLVCRRQWPDQAAVATILLENGANASARMRDGQTPLHMACTSISYELVQLLVAHGSDVLAEFFDVTTAQSITPVHLVCRLMPGTTALSLLLQKMERPYAAVWSTGWTPLHEAAQSLNSEAVLLLLTHGANPNTAADNGRTALHQVLAHSLLEDATIQRRARQVVSDLLATGKVNVNQRDNSGKTALSEADDAPEALRELLQS